MSDRSLSVNYEGRLVDLNITGMFNTGKATISFGSVTTKVAGVHKLAQKYLLELFTVLGSQPDYPDYGTKLIATLLGGNLQSVAHVTHVFNIASWKVVKKLRREQKGEADIPSDEQMNTVTLQKVTVLNDEIRFSAKLFTRAGQTLDLILPVAGI
jgi:hypothetical protein